MLRRLTSTTALWATVPLRLALGIAFIGHGAQKVLGSFNGPGWAKFTSFPAPFPFMRPAWLWMGAAAASSEPVLCPCLWVRFGRSAALGRSPRAHRLVPRCGGVRTSGLSARQFSLSSWPDQAILYESRSRSKAIAARGTMQGALANAARVLATVPSAVPAIMKLGGIAPGLIARIGLTRGSSNSAG